MADGCDRFDDAVLGAGDLVLRPLTLEDAPAMVRGGQDEVTQRWLPLPQPYQLDHAVEFIEHQAADAWTSGRGLTRAITWHGVFAGVIDLKKTDWLARTTEIGYWIGPDHRGLGLAGRASRLLGDWALADQGMERVEIRCATGNLASQRSAEAAGYTREGVARSAGFIHTGRVDLVVYAKVSGDL